MSRSERRGSPPCSQRSAAPLLEWRAARLPREAVFQRPGEAPPQARASSERARRGPDAAPAHRTVLGRRPAIHRPRTPGSFDIERAAPPRSSRSLRIPPETPRTRRLPFFRSPWNPKFYFFSVLVGSPPSGGRVNRLLIGLALGFGVPALLGPQTPVLLAPEVRKTAEALRESAFAGSQAARWVQELTDQVGQRMTGS